MLVSLLTLGSPEQLTGGYLYHRRLAELAGAHDARVEFVPVRRLVNPFRRATGEVVVVDSIAAARVSPWGRPDKPLAAIIHQPPGGVDAPVYRRVPQARFDRQLYRRCDLLIAASQALHDDLVAPPHGLPPDRMQVIAPGADVAPVPRGPVPDLRGDAPAAFLSVGNWMARKGTLEMLDAFAAMAEHGARLHLAGRDDIEPRYSKQVRCRLSDTRLAGRVVYHGAVTRDEVARLYAGADAFVLPSYREPYGTVYGEALARGLPVIGYRAGNLPHLIRHDVEGVLVPPGDVAGLTSALDRMTRDTAWRGRLAQAASRRGEALPTWSRTAAAFFDSLRELTARAR
jgi:glycosyltransferase involved in cell wall biosynthesis